MPAKNKRITTDEEVYIDYALYVVNKHQHAQKKILDAKRKRQRQARKKNRK